MKKVSLNDLLTAKVHLGHRSRRWNPKMKPYIYTKKSGIHIIDLVTTKECLIKAQKVLAQVTEGGDRILFIGTKKQARSSVKKWAEATGSFYLIERWPGGLLTNFIEIQRGLEKLRTLKDLKESAKWEGLSTRRQCQVIREIGKGERLFGGILAMDKPPLVLLVVDPRKEKAAVKEAIKKGITVIAVIDTNGDPSIIDFPIPGNDDASRSIDLLLELVSSGINSSGKRVGTQKEKADVVKSSSGLDGPIKESDLPSRAKSALVKAGYTTLSEVSTLTVEDLRNVEGIGDKTAEEIARKLGVTAV
ncbi:30S ribosomal protein S2 [Patescibacteria group bacterium]|nr:30S ribosomal protein S2 [Patescibacteria group bacterium]